MRILLDECGYTWEKAFDICRRTFAYTNHTVMSEALEKWNIDIFKMTLPRIFTIVQELDRRCREDLFQAFPGDVGKVIGRQGRIAKEIRTLVKAVAQRNNEKVTVEIVD